MASDSDWRHVCSVRTQAKEEQEKMVEQLIEHGWYVRAPAPTSSLLQMVGCWRSACSDWLSC